MLMRIRFSKLNLNVHSHAQRYIKKHICTWHDLVKKSSWLDSNDLNEPITQIYPTLLKGVLGGLNKFLDLACKIYWTDLANAVGRLSIFCQRGFFFGLAFLM